MNSYFDDRDTMYVGNDEFYDHQSRLIFINTINSWLLTDKGVQAKSILHSIREGMKSFDVNDTVQLNEDIIYLLYKYTYDTT
jgi:hypothetical protein